jgi:hypothetical protein
MRRFFAFGAALALAACGGGGGGTTPGAPTTVATPTPSSGPAGYARPTFTITIPASGSSSKTRGPKYVSSAALSVSVALTSDSAGINPSSFTQNPAVTNVNGTAD